MRGRFLAKRRKIYMVGLVHALRISVKRPFSVRDQFSLIAGLPSYALQLVVGESKCRQKASRRWKAKLVTRKQVVATRKSSTKIISAPQQTMHLFPTMLQLVVGESKCRQKASRRWKAKFVTRKQVVATRKSSTKIISAPQQTMHLFPTMLQNLIDKS